MVFVELQLLQLALLALSIFAVGRAFEALNLPALVGEIVVGMILGPGVLDWVPYHDALALLGQIGLLLLVLEGGLHIELGMLKKIGPRAFATAFTGTSLPVLLAWGILPRFSEFSTKEGLIAGTSLSSTAIGMAAKMMQDNKMLDTYLGQFICTAAMIDDVLSLILLAMIGSASGSDVEKEVLWGPSEGVWAICLPLVSSIAFIVIGTGIAMVTPAVMSAVRETPQFRKMSDVNWRQVVLLVLFVYAAALTAVAWGARTTFLLGAFLAGVSFSAIPDAVPAWNEHMPPLSAWTSRLFFASIGFAVPVSELFDAEALKFGVLLIVIAVVSKVMTGVFDWKNKWVIGWAMVGRGELGFVMAEEAFTTKLTGKLTFSITVWALLISTLLSPIVFRKLLKRQKQAQAQASTAPDATNISEVELQLEAAK